LADSRFAEYELQQLDNLPTSEHQLILQSNIVYDPKGWIAQTKQKIEGKIHPAMVSFYQERYLDKLPFEIYSHLQPNEFDKAKLEKSRQIQWVKWAVRTIRDAVGAKTYIQTGKFIYKKEDILNFCSIYLPPDAFETVQEIYRWKTDFETRERMIADFLATPDKCFALFSEYTKKIENIVNQIKNRPL